MATLAQNPKPQYFDNSGNPLSGGKLYTYEAGTTTPKDTYTTYAGTVANSNPITLDSAGRCSMWYGSGAYKVIIKDSDGNQLWSVDNIGSAGSGSGDIYTVDTISDLRNLSAGYSDAVYVLAYHGSNRGGGVFYWDSSSSASEDYGTVIVPSTSPATGRWIRILNGQLASVDMFGAYGDGSQVDTSAFTYADAWATTNGLPFRVTEGTYNIYTCTMSNKVFLEPNAIIKTASQTFTAEIAIAENDRTQHFNCSTSYVPVLSGNSIIRPEHFGADLTGTTNSYDEIYLCLECGIKTIVFDSGTIKTKRQRIHGYSYTIEFRNRSLLNQDATDTNGTLLYFDGATDCRIIGDGVLSSNGANADVIQVYNSSANIEIKGININSATRHGINIYRNSIIGVTTPKNIRIKDVDFYNVTEANIEIVEADNLSIENCYFSGAKKGIEVVESTNYTELRNVIVNGCSFESQTEDCIIVDRRVLNSANVSSELSILNSTIDSARRGIAFLGLWSNTDIMQFNVDNVKISNCTQQAVSIGNFPITSNAKIDVTVLDCSSETNNALWQFPAYYSGTTRTECQTPILVYSNSVSSLDSLNSGAGLINGNIDIKCNLKQNSVDKEAFYTAGYVYSSGSVVPKIQNVDVELTIKTPADKTWSCLGSVAYDVNVKGERYSTGYGKYMPFENAYISDHTLTNNDDQCHIVSNAGSGADITFTLPTISATNEKRRFIIETDVDKKITITTSGGATINMVNNDSATSVYSDKIGSRILIESSDTSANVWESKILSGYWTSLGSMGSVINAISDADYTVVTADNGKIIVTDNWTAARTITLPNASSYLGLEIIITKTVAQNLTIDPSSNGLFIPYIDLSSPYGAKYENTTDLGSITLKAVHAPTSHTLWWAITSENGTWAKV